MVDVPNDHKVESESNAVYQQISDFKIWGMLLRNIFC